MAVDCRRAMEMIPVRRVRKGSLVFFMMMAVMAVSGAIIGNMAFLHFSEVMGVSTTSSSQNMYSSFVIREEILGADCATERYGVFEREAIQNGDLSCIEVPEEDDITVWFEWWEDGDYSAKTYRISDGSVEALDDLADIPALINAQVRLITESEIYPALIWDDDQDVYRQAVFGYVGDVEGNLVEEAAEVDTGDSGDESSASSGDDPGEEGTEIAESSRRQAASAMYRINWSDAGDTEPFMQETWPDGGWKRVPHPVATASHAMETRIPAGSREGVSAFLTMAGNVEEMPEQAHARYQVYLPAAYFPVPDGFKLPGLAGTGSATGEWPEGGWGGRTTTGDNGWSARLQMDPDTTDLYVYAYHVGMEEHGSTFGGHTLETDTWHQIDQYVAMNTPGEGDGEVRLWVDGELVVNRTDIRWRDNENIKIESFWHQVYHGGSQDVSLPEILVYTDDIQLWDEEQPPDDTAMESGSDGS